MPEKNSYPSDNEWIGTFLGATAEKRKAMVRTLREHAERGSMCYIHDHQGELQRLRATSLPSLQLKEA